MIESATRMICSACGVESHDVDVLPFRCPAWQQDDDVDHVLRKVIDLDRVQFARTEDEHPFLRYRELLHSYQFSIANGLADEEWCELVLSLDDRVRAVDGVGFVRTPLTRDAALSDRLGFQAEGGLWVKNDSGNVGGSHKARHLFGVALYLSALERLGFLASGGEHLLAIASCGNAALAAAVIARAMENPLEVFIPVDANPAVVRRLGELGARITTCARAEGEEGDPCMARYRERIASGALPFTVQGPENGLVIEGGSTLAYELAESAADQGVRLDRLFVQVGGGALASACIAGLREASELGVGSEPLLHPVQTLASPLANAYERLQGAAGNEGKDFWADVARHRSDYMRPLEYEPKSLATGILDDETYDWRAILTRAWEGGTAPIRASEERIAVAHALANQGRERSICTTGVAGLAGLLELRERGEVEVHENAVVLFTGVQR